MPAQSPARWLRLIDCVAQCIVKLEVTRMHVLTSARNHGRSYCRCVPGMYGGHGPGWLCALTTRQKKYTVKNEPKSMISDPMKRKIPTTGG